MCGLPCLSQTDTHGCCSPSLSLLLHFPSPVFVFIGSVLLQLSSALFTPTRDRHLLNTNHYYSKYESLGTFCPVRARGTRRPSLLYCVMCEYNRYTGWTHYLQSKLVPQKATPQQQSSQYRDASNALLPWRRFRNALAMPAAPPGGGGGHTPK